MCWTDAPRFAEQAAADCAKRRHHSEGSDEGLAEGQRHTALLACLPLLPACGRSPVACSSTSRQ